MMLESGTGRWGTGPWVFGVIASLLFVGFEIKQSRDIALADIYQQRSAMQVDVILSLYAPEQFEEALTRRRNKNLEMTRFDKSVLTFNWEAKFVYFENLHFQYGLGMITEEEWAATQEWLSLEFLTPCRLRWWEGNKATWRKSFVSDVNILLSKIDSPPCDDSAMQQGQS